MDRPKPTLEVTAVNLEQVYLYYTRSDFEYNMIACF